jgi:hypothetical protein
VIPNLESEHLVITFAAIVDFARLFAVRRTADLPPAQQGCCAFGLDALICVGHYTQVDVPCPRPRSMGSLGHLLYSPFIRSHVGPQWNQNQAQESNKKSGGIFDKESAAHKG